MEEQRQRARLPGKAARKRPPVPLINRSLATEFEGYHKTLSTGAKSWPSSSRDERQQASARRSSKPGERGEIVLDHTPFYAEPADRSAMSAGSTPTTTTPSSPRSKA